MARAAITERVARSIVSSVLKAALIAYILPPAIAAPVT